MKNQGLIATAVSTQQTLVKRANVRRESQDREDPSANELATSVVAMHATLECTTDAIVITDEENRVTQFNQKLTKLWGSVALLTDSQPPLTCDQ
jgi:PAS domain-containing protein